MRLLYFTRGWTGHDRRIVTAFCAQRLEVAVVTLYDGITATAVKDIAGGCRLLGSLGLNRGHYPGQFSSVVASYKECENAFAPDLVLAGPLTDCAFVKALAAPGPPWVAQSWAFDVFWESEREMAARERAKAALLACNGLFADCQAVLDQCANIAGRQVSAHCVIPWGLEAPPETGSSVRDRVRAELGLSNRKLVLFVRGLEEIHAPEVILDAWRVGEFQTLRALLLLAADGDLRTKVDDWIRSWGLQESIHVLGRVTHARILQLLAAADVYVSSSACDGTSVSLLEAMGAGVVPVVSDRGGSPEWVAHRKTGWLVPFGDVGAMVQALKEALTIEPLARKRLVDENRRAIAARADWPRNAARLVQFLTSLAC